MSVAVNIIRDTVNDILTHPKGALICLMPIPLGLAILSGLFYALTAWVSPQFFGRHVYDDNLTVVLRIVFALSALGVLMAWTAVSWHRLIILEETSRRFVPSWPHGVIARYIGLSIGVMIVLVIAMFPLGLIALSFIDIIGEPGRNFRFILGAPPPAFTLQGLLFWLFFNGLYTGLLLRMSIVLPALSVGRKKGFGDIWQATSGSFWSVFVPLGIIVPLINTVFSFLSSLISFGGVFEILSAALLFVLGIGVVTRLHMHFFPASPSTNDTTLPAAPGAAT